MEIGNIIYYQDDHISKFSSGIKRFMNLTLTLSIKLPNCYYHNNPLRLAACISKLNYYKQLFIFHLHDIEEVQLMSLAASFQLFLLGGNVRERNTCRNTLILYSQCSLQLEDYVVSHGTSLSS